MREKWAGANSNRGYGHPKAEGYQATPPARILSVRVRSFNASGSGVEPPDGNPIVRDIPHRNRLQNRS